VGKSLNEFAIMRRLCMAACNEGSEGAMVCMGGRESGSRRRTR